MSVLDRLLRRDLHSLAAPYALDALEPDERRRFERHLQGCPRCAAEVRELGEDAVRLAWSTTAPAPAALRERVLTAVRTTPQEAPDPSHPAHPSQALPNGVPRGRAAHGPARDRTPRFRSLLAPLSTATAAAALVVASLFAVQATQTQDKLDQERAQAREIAHVLAAPDARATSDRDAQGRGIGVVASASERRAVVTLSGLATPSGGRVHQLWLMRPNVQPRSLGLFEGDTPLIADGLSTNATSLAVTVEPQGGSTQPTTSPVAQLALKSVGFGE
ncbi:MULTISPECIES: anti-sigma factor [Streptomyces]|jgi:anti-sigma-K factor RskA|uniref:anti-sigma factor n=1 Tax=Streptomyces TaxID=1883 RepID=UPI000BB0FAD7|nr:MULTISPECIES: anti-sigma factor [Streptomyces]MCT9107194.1 anti-sigma factor [Streptomyces mirabilis]MCX4432746.1 anti-sigma factor [Streptomyces mirabilis]PBD00144.1 anti-sigma-K factor RskA [Streptomyces sp. Ag82_O1-15]